MNNLENEQKILRLYEFGDFVLDMDDSMDDPPDNRLVLNGDPYEISDKSFALLCIFVKDPEREFAREELVNELWSKDNVKSGELQPARRRKPHTDEENKEEGRKRSIRNKLHRQIAMLRDSIGWENIETTNTGYKFVARVVVRVIEQKADLKFNEWIFQDKKGRRITGAILAGVLLSVAYLITYLILGNNLWHKPIIVFSLIQSILIVVALFVSRRIFDPSVKVFWEYDPSWLMKKSGYDEPEEWKNAKAGAKIALSDYAVYWMLLLGSWFFIYLLLFLTLYLGSETGQQSKLLYVLNIALTTFNNCNSLMISLCFIILNNPNAYRSEEKQQEHKARLHKITKWGAAAILFFAFIESFFLFVIQTNWTGSIKDNPIIMRADIVSGIVGGITLALYLGRVQTRLLGPPLWISLAFYLYAVIQPLFVFIKDFVRGELIIETALILKALLYLYVAWLFQSGRLLFYFVRVRAIFERVDLDWRTFLSILR
jgi:DNA-binding winged helix-turn-helix (wHTH) protein